MNEGFASTSVGRVHYQRAGSGDPLLLMHGNGQSAWSWEDVVPALAESFDVIAWDMPGQGDSEQLPRHLTIDDYADAAVAVLDAAGVTRATAAGSSIGGQICASLGARHGDRFEHLIYVETNFRPESWWAEHWTTIEERFAVPVQDMEVLRERFREPTPATLQRWNIDRCKAGGRTMMSAMWAIREFDMAAALQASTTKSSMLFGANGPTIGAREEFEAAVPGAAVEVLDQSGHFPMSDQPEEFIAAVQTFCKQR
jgi:pimeloyl-ACP methyl ester carboxylesterase